MKLSTKCRTKQLGMIQTNLEVFAHFYLVRPRTLAGVCGGWLINSHRLPKLICQYTIIKSCNIVAYS